MTLDTSRLFEHVHGHLGWLGAALLAHPAILLRDPRRRADLAVLSATAIVTVTAGLGCWLYVAYRAELKRAIFIDAPEVGLLFERKEHLAVGAVLLAWSGCAAYLGARSASAPMKPWLRTIAFRSFVASAVLTAVVALLGTIVAVHRSF